MFDPSRQPLVTKGQVCMTEHSEITQVFSKSTVYSTRLQCSATVMLLAFRRWTVDCHIQQKKKYMLRKRKLPSRIEMSSDKKSSNRHLPIIQHIMTTQHRISISMSSKIKAIVTSHTKQDVVSDRGITTGDIDRVRGNKA